MESQTQMTKDPAQKNMTAPPKDADKKGPQMVRIFCLKEFRIENLVKDSSGTVIEDRSIMVKPGQIIGVTKHMAKDLCKPLQGAYAFSGERYNADKDITHHDLTRARLATNADLVAKKDETLDSLED